MENNIFEELQKVNVNGHTEKKKTGANTELTYLSWPWAVAEVMKRYPDVKYEIIKFNGLPYVYDPLTGYMVYTSVTINGITHEMWLPVMDGANNAMKAEPYEFQVKNPNFKWAKFDKERNGYYDKYGNRQDEYVSKRVNAATMFDINKTIMRCLVKNFAMFGLGLYIYAGEDLPNTEETPQEAPEQRPAVATKESSPDIKRQHTEPSKQPYSEDDPVSENELMTMEALMAKNGIDPTQWFRMWPNVTKKHYTWLMEKLNGNNRQAV